MDTRENITIVSYHAVERYSERYLGKIIPGFRNGCEADLILYNSLKRDILARLRNRETERLSSMAEFVLKKSKKNRPILEENVFYFRWRNLIFVVSHKEVLTVFVLTPAQIEELDAIDMLQEDGLNSQLLPKAETCQGKENKKVILMCRARRYHPLIKQRKIRAGRRHKAGRLRNTIDKILKAYEVETIYQPANNNSAAAWLREMFPGEIINEVSLDEQNLGILNNPENIPEENEEASALMREDPLDYIVPNGECLAQVLIRVRFFLMDLKIKLTENEGSVLIITSVSALLALRILMEKIEMPNFFLKDLIAIDPPITYGKTVYSFDPKLGFALLEYNKS